MFSTTEGAVWTNTGGLGEPVQWNAERRKWKNRAIPWVKCSVFCWKLHSDCGLEGNTMLKWVWKGNAGGYRKNTFVGKKVDYKNNYFRENVKYCSLIFFMFKKMEYTVYFRELKAWSEFGENKHLVTSTNPMHIELMLVTLELFLYLFTTLYWIWLWRLLSVLNSGNRKRNSAKIKVELYFFT